MEVAVMRAVLTDNRDMPHALRRFDGTDRVEPLHMLFTVDEAASLLRTTRRGIDAMIERGSCRA